MTVIERQEILGPSPELNYKRSTSQERVQNGPKTTQSNGESNMEFDLSNCLDLVKAGMESIIEDQVTSVFEAEELRSWNLLTRTNRQYEFLTWRLTIIWAMGFVVRYMFLLPLRIMIFVIGVIVMVFSTWVVSLVPFVRLRNKLGKISYKTSIRVIIRGLSIHARFHDEQYRPRANGFCVANHTSPIDVGVLSIKTCFSLVWWLIACTACIGTLPDGKTKQRINYAVSVMCFNFLSRCISAVITYHDAHYKPKNGICVANHTSPIDALVLMCDNCYSLVRPTFRRRILEQLSIRYAPLSPEHDDLVGHRLRRLVPTGDDARRRRIRCGLRE
ncbi:hypothetical protein HF086_008158 [Spodoptera exigua]|uniref:Uncharacterized protein n=1 Tax=Spodoptera exigua TaxID=7107 RepID=A0A922S9E2_SPOEX|nr:hypothetical protein HF086_008158 [Spodoptera exigua]